MVYLHPQTVLQHRRVGLVKDHEVKVEDGFQRRADTLYAFAS